MAIHKIKDNIFSVGAVDWDRRLFDELIPLPDGTSYNSYLIFGSEKSALIDTVDPEKKEELINNLKRLKVEKLDYIIANHAEQDHSGTIPDLLSLYPDARVVTNPKCKGFLKDLLHIDDDKFIEIADGDTLSLGNKTLEFIYNPWVHWPETMSTYLAEDKILFSCDFFGSHRATSSLFVQDEYKVVEDAKRYYAEIMMPFRNHIRKNIEKISSKDIELIAPSHGPVYDNPRIIVDAYKEWISDKVVNRVLIPYVSMHGSTEVMVSKLVEILTEKGIDVIPFNLTKTDIGEFAMVLVDAATLVLATPTVLAGPHPSAVYAAYLVNALRPKLKVVSIMGSLGWGGKTVDILTTTMKNVKADFIEPLLIKGLPKGEDSVKIEEFGKKIIEKHKELGLI